LSSIGKVAQIAKSTKALQQLRSSSKSLPPALTSPRSQLRQKKLVWVAHRPSLRPSRRKKVSL